MQLPTFEGFPGSGTISGLSGADRALWLLRLGRPVLVLCRGEEEAVRLHRDLCFFAAALGVPAAVLVPAPDRRLRAPRFAALARIGAGEATIVVADAETAVAPIFDAARLTAEAVELRAGGEADPEFLGELLVEMGYRRVQLVADAGEFALRQGRIDVFPAAAEQPVRVEHAAGRVTALRAFEIATQLTYRDVPAVRLLPALEPEGGLSLCAALAGRVVVFVGDLGPEAEALPVPDVTIEEQGCALHSIGQSTALSNPPDPVPAWLLAQPVQGFGLTARERRAAGEGLGVIGPRLAAFAAQRTVLIAAGTLGEAERVRDLLAAAQENESADASSGAVERRAKGAVESPLSGGETPDAASGRRPSGSETTADASPARPRPRDAVARVPIIGPGDIAAHQGSFALVHGFLSAGFYDPGSDFLALTSAELFGPRPPARPGGASRIDTLIASLDELAPGDCVVHLEHGVGLFGGTERTHDQDFLRLEYAGGGRLLVPVERIDLLRRHHASGSARPRLDTIGGTAWRAAKGRAREKVREMAAELLRQAAEREAAAGFAFSPDDERHREFADAFGFEPTPDQLASCSEIRAAMELPQPMDWLLCGDVGYGKTEVAMRAAFKAAADGKQVAVVAPTTLLAEQHADVFAARFAPFPIPVDALTRFTPADEERAVLARLQAGGHGIVVGTHRLIAADVVFADLGLVVVDEEQRFGVEHKERIRRLRPGVDVLTLTATPIPRTLAMALAGARGISRLETPPEERLAAKSVVARFEARLVREALEREFARGGQAFFVHNRVESIGRVGVFLQGLLPGRRIGVAHARMAGTALEEVMHRFHAGEIDLLLATAIVGAGLDVPRANTLIVDRADRFGLADLYQLKGRVGRGDRRAFAYFLVPHENRMTDEAKERLAALTELSFLGAGFRLALRDLEIRGAGDLLGAEQSGHIAAVGFDLYREMLAEAVAELKGEAPKAAFEPMLELRLVAHLPAAWIDDPGLRFSVLRRVGAARDRGAVADLRRELADRFGPPPPEAAHLLDLAGLKAACRFAGVARIEEVADRRYRVLFADAMIPPDKTLESLATASGERVYPLPEAGFELDCAKRSWGEGLRALEKLLALAVGGKR